MTNNYSEIQGLVNHQVILAREKFGINKLDYKKENGFLDTVKRIAEDPMMILLLAACSIYFISGKIGDGIFLAVAIIFQTSISLYQLMLRSPYFSYLYDRLFLQDGQSED